MNGSRVKEGIQHRDYQKRRRTDEKNILAFYDSRKNVVSRSRLRYDTNVDDKSINYHTLLETMAVSERNSLF
jgi:hypothetical protein